MKQRLTFGGVVLAAVAPAIVAVAIAQTDGTEAGDSSAAPESGTPGVGVPEGPYVDFCPNPEQVDAHLERYGTDYKPTVDCGPDDGAAPIDPTRSDDDDLPDAVRRAKEKTDLLASRPGQDVDGDPTTIEGVSPDGRDFVISVATTNPQLYRGMTPAEFARKFYP